MTPDPYDDLIEFLDRRFEKLHSRVFLLHEQAREDRRAMMEEIDARVALLERRLEDAELRLDRMERRRRAGSSGWGTRLPEA